MILCLAVAPGVFGNYGGNAMKASLPKRIRGHSLPVANEFLLTIINRPTHETSPEWKQLGCTSLNASTH
jgi:hypothetical protein